MVWFSEEVLTPEMIMTNYLLKLRKVSLDDSDDDVGKGDGSANGTSSISVSYHYHSPYVDFFIDLLLP